MGQFFVQFKTESPGTICQSHVALVLASIGLYTYDIIISFRCIQHIVPVLKTYLYCWLLSLDSILIWTLLQIAGLHFAQEVKLCEAWGQKEREEA